MCKVSSFNVLHQYPINFDRTRNAPLTSSSLSGKNTEQICILAVWQTHQVQIHDNLKSICKEYNYNSYGITHSLSQIYILADGLPHTKNTSIQLLEPILWEQRRKIMSTLCNAKEYIMWTQWVQYDNNGSIVWT